MKRLVIESLLSTFLRPRSTVLSFFSSTLRSCTTSRHQYPEVLEEDLEETFTRSQGAGGQNVNKRSTCVVLRHIPTGIIVKCQEQRRQAQNRKIARRMMRDKLDLLINGDDALEMQKKQLFLEHREQKHLKSKARLEKLQASRQLEEKTANSPVADEAPLEETGVGREASNFAHNLLSSGNKVADTSHDTRRFARRSLAPSVEDVR